MGAVDTHRDNDWIYKPPIDLASWGDLLGSVAQRVQDLYSGTYRSQRPKRHWPDCPCNSDFRSDQYALWACGRMDDERWIKLRKEVAGRFRTAKIVLRRSWNENVGCSAGAKFVRNGMSQETSTASQQDALLMPVSH